MKGFSWNRLGNKLALPAYSSALLITPELDGRLYEFGGDDHADYHREVGSLFPRPEMTLAHVAVESRERTSKHKSMVSI